MAQPLEKVLAYRHSLTDAVADGPITPHTQLVPLCQPHPGTARGALLAALTGISYPGKPCTLIGRGACYPPQSFGGAPPYALRLSCNRLLVAPVLRLECIWQDHQLIAALEFPIFASKNSASFTFHRNVERGGGDFADELRCRARGATSVGFNNARSLRAELGATGEQVLLQLRKYLTGDKAKDLRLRFHSPLEDPSYGIAAVLPYLTEMPLPTLSAPEYAAFMPLKPDRTLHELINHIDAPFPMVPLKGSDTFGSVTQAALEYYESSKFSFLEQQVALDEWAKVAHRGVLYRVGSTIALAVQFKPFRLLGGPAGGQLFDLPDRFHSRVEFELPEISGDCVWRMSCERSPVPLNVHWSYNALFVIKKPSDAVRTAAIDPSLGNPRKNGIDVHFRPQMPDRQLAVKLETATNLKHPDSVRWQRILLNQDHSTLPTVDLATGTTIRTDQSAPVAPLNLDPEIAAVVEKAFVWMLRWRNWNAEQLTALISVREAVGGIVLVSGPAGTGKTLLIQAITVFFYMIGLHVLVLAPANSNLSDFMGKLKELFGEHSAVPVKATRVYPPSADFSPKKISQGQKCIHTPEATAESTSGDILEFEMVRADLQYMDDKYTTHRDYGLPAQVFRAARDGDFELHESLSVGGERLDVWTVLRQCMKQAAAGAFDWDNSDQVQRYQKAYELCKAHYMSHTRMVCTTTGNVRCSDIVDNWAANKHGTQTKGIVIVLDEACKDNEIDSVSALLNPQWRNLINGMVMLGDERQLEPTNTGAKGRMVFNPFNDRIGIPLMSRLNREGFPCVRLLEQHRMNHHIAEWPFKEFYPVGMRNGPGTFLTLRQKLPGLFDCLTGILRDLGTTFDNPLITEQEMDRSVRTHYLELIGTRDNSKRSAFVLEHVRFFCDKVYWNLHAYFGERTNEKVMIICAYKEAKKCYEDAMRYLQRRYRIPDAQLPRIATIDSSQGAEAPMTIIDCSVQRYDPRSRLADIGFVDDDKRMNVAMTRAQEVRWILGGNCNVENRVLRQPNTPAYVRYRESVSVYSGEMTSLGAPWKRGQLKKDGNSWLNGLHKYPASATSMYREDVRRPVAKV